MGTRKSLETCDSRRTRHDRICVQLFRRAGIDAGRKRDSLESVTLETPLAIPVAPVQFGNRTMVSSRARLVRSSCSSRTGIGAVARALPAANQRFAKRVDALKQVPMGRCWLALLRYLLVSRPARNSMVRYSPSCPKSARNWLISPAACASP